MRSPMKILISAGIAAAATGAAAIGLSAPAGAQGFYFNAPGIHVHVGHPYHRYYGPRYYDYAPGYYGGGWATYNGCRPGFTIQDGVCKPYRGF